VYRNDFPWSDGEAGRLIREHDWASTSLGPPDNWPDALRATVSMMLSSPFAMCMAWGPELIFFYNDAYVPMLGKRHGTAMGKPIKDVWWEIWDSIDPWIDQTLAGGVVNLVDTHLVMLRNGYEEDTWWTFAYSPLRDGNGNISGFLDVCIETTEKVKNERRIADEQARLRQMFDEAPSFMALLVGPQHRFEMVNAAYMQLIGHRDVVGRTVAEALGDAAAQGYVSILDRVYTTGEPYVGSDARYDVQAEPGGAVNERHVDFIYQPLKDSAGKVYGIFVNGVDITERKRADEARTMLHRELVHRIKNTMAVTSAVVTASMRHAGSLEDARQTVSARIEALARAQSLLTRPNVDAYVEEVVREAIAPHLDDWARATIAGPNVLLSEQQAMGLSLAIYELATNAVKYGALSGVAGTVSVNWEIGADNAFTFTWQEDGGPAVSPPSRSGFGSRLTNRIVAAYFAGTGETRYDPNGIRYVLRGTARVKAEDELADAAR
jgi:PAS domain S-box-containing protein